jgi:6-phosphofructokinase 1
LLGAAFGVAALDLVAQDKFGRMVAWQNRRVVDVPIEEAIAQYGSVEVNGALVATALGLNTYIGEVQSLHS